MRITPKTNQKEVNIMLRILSIFIFSSIFSIFAFLEHSDAQECFIGEVRIFAGNFAPRNWALCNGQLLPISQNQALFSILGTTYGGDGRTTFSLPDLSDHRPGDVHYIIAS